MTLNTYSADGAPAPVENTPSPVAASSHKSSRKKIIIASAIAAVLILGGGGGAMAYNSAQAKALQIAVVEVQEANTSNEQLADDLTRSIERAGELVVSAGELEIDTKIVDALDKAVLEATNLLPFTPSTTGDKKVTAAAANAQEEAAIALVDAQKNLDQGITDFTDAIETAQALEAFTALTTGLEGDIAKANAALKDSDGKVSKQDSRDALAAVIKEATEVANTEFTPEIATDFEAVVIESTKTLTDATDKVNKDVKAKAKADKEAKDKADKAAAAAAAKAAQQSANRAQTAQPRTYPQTTTKSPSSKRATPKATPKPITPKTTTPKPAAPKPSTGGGGWQESTVDEKVCWAGDTSGNSWRVPCN